MPKVLEAMGAVERHRFVDSGLVNQAYEDTSLPIGLGADDLQAQHRRTHGRIAAGAELVRTSGSLGRVLEIGTGCGYQAAVLSRLAREVYSIERLRGLHDKARVHLRPLRLANVHLLLGMECWALSRSPLRWHCGCRRWHGDPAQWCEQLAVGGRLVALLRVRMGGKCCWWWTRRRTD